MARFRATIKGQRGEASRLGHPKSGITAKVNGWDSGIWVNGFVDEDGKDRFEVYTTGGSHFGGKCRRIAIIVDGKPQRVPRYVACTVEPLA